MNQDTIINSPEYKLMDFERQLHVKHLQIESLLEVTKAINNNLSYESLFKIYEFILRAQLGVAEFVLYLKQDDVWERTVLYGIEEKDFKDINVETDLIRFQKTTPIENNEIEQSDLFKVIVPVYHKTQPLAFILLGKVNLYDNESLEEKLKFIQTITNIIVVAIENNRLVNQQIESEKYKKELELAANMQSMLIPDELPNNDYLVMDGIYKPHLTIGGDYYDFIKINEDEYIFCIADISGKGAPAAILMANFQAVLRTMAAEKYPIRSLVSKLNKRVIEITKGEKFITLFLAVYNIRSKTLEYVNAGHNPSIIVRQGQVETLDKGCTILGMFDPLPSIDFGVAQLETGDIIFNYTDGLTDTSNERDEMFDTDMLIHFAKQHVHLNPKEFNQNLIRRIEIFKGANNYMDDISLLSCKIR